MSAPALTGNTHRALSAVFAIVVLALVGLAAAGGVRPPEARGVSAPATQFSAARAFQQVEAVATEPHPIGSPAQDRVREHLLTSLRELGLTPEIQDATTIQGGQLASSAGGAGFARVRNIVARVPGSSSTGRIFLVAHYDSVQNGPGANDDMAGTSAILETARALLASKRLRNDVVLVLTDGEEACLCGAKAFVDQHPLAEGGGIALNLESRGGTGPAIMFETSDHNKSLIDAYAQAPHPVGTSFAVEIYRLLPNDTDFTAFREAGFGGLNAAYIDGAAVYHAPTDVPSSLNQASLQQLGENALALTRVLGDWDLTRPGSKQDATYFPAPGRLIRYSGVGVWPIAVIAVIAVFALAWLAWKRQHTTGRRLFRALLLTAVPIIAAPLLAQGFWLLLTVIRPKYAALPIDPYRPGWFRLAVVAIVLTVLFGWYSLLRRRSGPTTLAIAGLAWLAVLGVVLAAYVPGGSYLAALPALAGTLAAFVALLLRGWWSVLPVTLGAAVGVVVLLPAVIMLFPALGLVEGGAAAFLTVLLGLALLPVVDLIHPTAAGRRGPNALRGRRLGALPALIALLAVVGCTTTGLTTDRFDAEHPAPTSLMYALDADTDTAQWLSDEPSTQQWTSQYVSGDPHRVDQQLPVFGPREMRSGKAPAADVPAPELTLVSDTPVADGRRLQLRLRPQRQVRLTALHVAAGVAVTQATVGGRPVAPAPAEGAWGWGFVFHAPPAEGIDITLTVRTAAPVKFRAMDGSDGLTALPGFHARPADVGVVGSHISEMLAVARSYTL